MPVPNTFANATATIPLSQLDANFATTITLGNTAIQLGNTVSTLNNMTLANVTVTSGNVTITNVTVTTANVTTANIATAVITTANVTTANITTGNVSGNLTFTSTGQRILGDFSNATFANRVMFQTSTVNGISVVSAIPNGTGTATAFHAFNNSDPTNAARAVLQVSSAEVTVSSGIAGTGTYLPMTFYTGGSERMRIDTAGNLGLGVTPSAWNASFYRVLQVSDRGAHYASNTTSYSTAPYLFIGNNAFSDVASGAGFKYVTTNPSAQYRQVNAEHQWFTAASGTAGNAITFTQAMTLDSSGNLGIGTSSPSSYTSGDNLVVANATGNGQMTLAGADAGNPTIQFRRVSAPSTTRGYIQYDNTSDWLRFATNGSERMRLDSSGSLGLGVTPSAWYDPTNWAVAQIGYLGIFANKSSNDSRLYSNAFLNTSGLDKYLASGYASQYKLTTGGHYWFTAPSGTAGNTITFTQAMTLNASGGLGVGEASIATDTRLHLKHTTDNCIAKIQSTFGAELQLINGGGSELSVINATGNNVLSLRTGSTERARIDASGYTQFSSNLVMPYQGAPTSKAAAATLTGAELVTGLLNTTGTTYTITLPTGTNIEGALTWVGNNVSLDWTVINTASGTITIGANGNTTLGSLTIATGTSAGFRIRRTAANTFTVYRMR
jgi:hypothetical protein